MGLAGTPVCCEVRCTGLDGTRLAIAVCMYVTCQDYACKALCLEGHNLFGVHLVMQEGYLP